MTGATPKKLHASAKSYGVKKTIGYSKIAKPRNRLSNGKHSTSIPAKSSKSSMGFSKTSANNKKHLEVATMENKQVEKEEENIEFKEDPSALQSILNNQGVTEQLLQENAVKEGRPSMVSNNTYLFLDGRPSLCRRVPIQRAKPVEAGARTSILSGPKRVLPSAKRQSEVVSRTASLAGHRNSFLKPTAANSRHSLYSVVQGRYSNANEGRMSLPAANNNKSTDAKGKMSIPVPKSTVAFKTPPPLRVSSRDAGLCASPALRVKQPLGVTPLPRRSCKKGDQQRGVKWADEPAAKPKDDLAVSLFQDFSPSTSPKLVPSSKQLKTPVSILRNSKLKKKQSAKSLLADEEGTVEIVKPLVLNERHFDENVDQSRVETSSRDAPSVTRNNKPGSNLSNFSASKISEIEPRVLQQTSPVLTSLAKTVAHPNDEEDARSKPQSSGGEKETEVVEVDRVLDILNQHVSKVKRRSVQGELTNVMKHIAARLKGTGLSEVTEEEDERESDVNTVEHNSAPAPTNVCVTKEEDLPPHSTQEETVDYSSCPLTPGTVKDIREHGDPKTKSDFERLVSEMERINEELQERKKEQLLAFQLKKHHEELQKLQRKKEQLQASQGKEVQRHNEVPKLITSEKVPDFSKLFVKTSPAAFAKDEVTTTTQRNKDVSCASWDSVLRSETTSPACSNPGDAKTRSMEATPATPPFQVDRGAKFVGTASPCVAALHLESSSGFFLSKQREIEKRFDLGDNAALPSRSVLSDAMPGLTSRSNGSIATQPPMNNSHSQPACADEAKYVNRILFEGTSRDNRLNADWSVDRSGGKPPATVPESKSTSDSLRFAFEKHFTKENINHLSPVISKDETPLPSAQQSLNSMFTKSEENSPAVSSSPIVSQARLCPPSTPGLFAPYPVFPLPPRTPAAFRALKMVNNRASPAHDRPGGNIVRKQQFAQALLDEEVSLLTCRVVKPSVLLQSQANYDPVAHSLANGDDKHFIPIVKTPSATPRRHRRSSIGDSAFSKYLRN